MAHNWVLWIYSHSNGSGVVGTKVYCYRCGLNASAPVPNVTPGGYCTCHGWSVLYSTRELSNTPCDSTDDGSSVIAMGDRLADYYGSLPSGAVSAVDLDSTVSGFDALNPMIAYYPNGKVLTSGDERYVVTDTQDGDNRFGVVMSGGTASGSQGGRQGTYTLIPMADGMGYHTSFDPDWSGGVEDSRSSSSLSGGSSTSGGGGSSTSGGGGSSFGGSVFISTSGGDGSSSSGGSSVSFVAPIIYGGSSSSGSSSSGDTTSGNNSSGGFYYPDGVPSSTVNNNNSSSVNYDQSTYNYYYSQPTYNTVSTTSTGSDGQEVTTEYKVITVPQQTTSLGNGATITTYDYSGILSAIGGTLSAGFDRMNYDLDVMNENQRIQLETDSAVDVAESSDPDIDLSSDQQEAQAELDKLQETQSGWGFDFGLGNNPIGSVFTKLFGNPVLSLGSSDEVCNVDFELTKDIRFHYSFKLSDYFPPAFRSLMLMILTFIFAIASLKAISGAFQ